eukprot:UN10642
MEIKIKFTITTLFMRKIENEHSVVGAIEGSVEGRVVVGKFCWFWGGWHGGGVGGGWCTCGIRGGRPRTRPVRGRHTWSHRND